MFWTVDRIENDTAVVETDGGFVDIPLAALPEGTAEGSVIHVEISRDEEEKRKKRIKEKMNRLFVD